MALTPVMDELAGLCARRRIEDLITRRGRAADAKDPDAILRCHVPGSRDEHGIFNGTIEEFVAYLRDHHYTGDRYGTQRHYVSNLLVDLVADDRAAAESLHIAIHRVRLDDGDFDVEIGGRYLDRFRRVDGDWLLETRAVVYDWSRSWPVDDAVDGSAATGVGRPPANDPRRIAPSE